MVKLGVGGYPREGIETLKPSLCGFISFTQLSVIFTGNKRYLCAIWWTLLSSVTHCMMSTRREQEWFECSAFLFALCHGFSSSRSDNSSKLLNGSTSVMRPSSKQQQGLCWENKSTHITKTYMNIRSITPPTSTHKKEEGRDERSRSSKRRWQECINSVSSYRAAHQNGYGWNDSRLGYELLCCGGAKKNASYFLGLILDNTRKYKGAATKWASWHSRWRWKREGERERKRETKHVALLITPPCQ